jgi:S1-C subfamily serine protease
LRNGDRIVEFDGKSVKSTKQLTDLIADTPAGAAVKLKFVRDGSEQSASITPAERPRRKVANNEEAQSPYGRQPQP